MEHEIATPDELNHKEQPRGRLEARVQPYQERVIRGGLEDVLLRLHPVNILVVRYQRLLDYLHRVDALRRLELDHEDLGIGTPSDHADELKIVEAVLALIGGALGAGHLVQRQLLALHVTRCT